MSLQKEVNEALATVRDGRLGNKSPEDLKSNLKALHRAYDAYTRTPVVKAAIEAYQHEISMRKQHETTVEISNLKGSVERLTRARTVDWWILAAGWIAAVAAVVAVLLALFLKH